MNSYLFEMDNREKICKFCCAKCDSNFKTIDESTLQNLNVLLVSMDLATSAEHVMCKSCEEMLIKCFDFKTKCLYSQNFIVPRLLDSKDNVELDLKHVDVKENVTATGVPKNQDICRLCLSFAENCSAVSLDVEKGDAMLKKMIEQCLPELDLSVIKNHVICASCYGSLVDCFHFVVNYLIAAEKSHKYCEGDSNELGSIKIEQIFYEENDTKPENLAEINDPNCSLNEETEIKSVGHDTKRFEDAIIVVKSEQPSRLQTKEKCSMPSFENDHLNEANYENGLARHLLKHTDSSEVTMYKCDSCLYQTKHKAYLKRHSLVHKNPSEVKLFKCDQCSFQTKHKGALRTHMSTHKNLSGVAMYKCDFCSFQTKHRYDHKVHLQGHKDASNKYVYKCDICSYQAKEKRLLRNHSLAHKDPSEVIMYKCEYCSYQSKYEDTLKKHFLLEHRDPSEITMYKCNTCSYETRYRNSLISHLLVHKDPSEVKMYNCIYCSHKTKRKGSLKIHLLTHKDPSEMTMYKCETCFYETSNKCTFEGHLLTHKDPSEVTMYQCNSCSFQTKHKQSLKTHLLIHKDPSEVKMHKCSLCSYQTKIKYSLKIHLQSHKDPTEVTIYKCDGCSFKTKSKSYLKKHIVSLMAKAHGSDLINFTGDVKKHLNF